jgi:hypothetical protein
MGFESTITMFETAKTIHASDHAATVIGLLVTILVQITRESPVVNKWALASRIAKLLARENWQAKHVNT